MKLYNCVTELEKELKAIDLEDLKPEDKGLLAIKVCDACLHGEILDAEIVVHALLEIALSLVPIPKPLEIIDGKKILLSYPAPAGEPEIVLAAWGNEYVTWKLRREEKEFNYGHYYHIADYGSSRAAYLEAYRDFQRRLYEEKSGNGGSEGEPAKMPFYLET